MYCAASVRVCDMAGGEGVHGYVVHLSRVLKDGGARASAVIQHLICSECRVRTDLTGAGPHLSFLFF